MNSDPKNIWREMTPREKNACPEGWGFILLLNKNI